MLLLVYFCLFLTVMKELNVSTYVICYLLNEAYTKRRYQRPVGDSCGVYILVIHQRKEGVRQLCVRR